MIIKKNGIGELSQKTPTKQQPEVENGKQLPPPTHSSGARHKKEE